MMLGYLVALMLIGMGAFLLYKSAFERLPAPDEMVPVTGIVDHYSVHRSRNDDPNRIDFKLWDDPTQYWTNEIADDWAEGKFDGTELQVGFHVEPGPVYRLGKVKTFGLTVNGRVITRLEDDIAGETRILRYWFPPLGVLAIVVGLWRLRRKTPPATSAGV